LKNDEYPSVEVFQVAEIDFKEVLQRISKGESVFIMRRHMQELNLSMGLDETSREPWYFT